MAIIEMGKRPKPTKNSNADNTKLEEKLKLLQEKGRDEIEQYKTLVNNFIQGARKLALTNRIMDDFISDQVRNFLITEILETLIQPIFEGDKPSFIPEEEYLEMREDIYRDLATKYLDGEDLDKPF